MDVTGGTIEENEEPSFLVPSPKCLKSFLYVILIQNCDELRNTGKCH